jgi:flagellar export protein FliJ
MPFRFPLDGLLRLRATLTQQEEIRLESIALQLNIARKELEALQQRRQEFDRRLQADLRQGTLAGEMQLRLVGRRGLREAEQRLARAIAELQRAWSDQRERFKEARQRQEVLESVRQNQFTSYREQQRRRDQQLIDDLFQSRTHYHKGHKQA